MSASSTGAPVLVAAGGTGGHVIPALAVVEVLRELDVPVVWVGTRSGIEARLVPAAGIDIRWIDVAGLRGVGMGRLLRAPLALTRAAWQCLGLLRELQPRAVLGMGGFVSGPVGLAAVLSRRRLVLHEQNAVAGLTNRYLARWASRVFSAWPNVFAPGIDADAVGNPVRHELLTRAAESGETTPSREALYVLVIGGSRGARFLNEIVPQAVDSVDVPLVIRHQSGEADQVETASAYELIDAQREQRRRSASSLHERRAPGSVAPLEFQVEPFIDDMAAAYADADLVICRAGAMTVTELSALGRASLLVPFPHAVDDHQTRNAERLSEKGAAILLPQSNLSAERLADELVRLHGDRAVLAHMARQARDGFDAGAADAVARALIAEPVAGTAGGRH